MTWEVGEKVAVLKRDGLYASVVSKVSKTGQVTVDGARFTKHGVQIGGLSRGWCIYKMTEDLAAQCEADRARRAIEESTKACSDLETLKKALEALRERP